MIERGEKWVFKREFRNRGKYMGCRVVATRYCATIRHQARIHHATPYLVLCLTPFSPPHAERNERIRLWTSLFQARKL